MLFFRTFSAPQWSFYFQMWQIAGFYSQGKMTRPLIFQLFVIGWLSCWLFFFPGGGIWDQLFSNWYANVINDAHETCWFQTGWHCQQLQMWCIVIHLHNSATDVCCFDIRSRRVTVRVRNIRVSSWHSVLQIRAAWTAAASLSWHVLFVHVTLLLLVNNTINIYST